MPLPPHEQAAFDAPMGRETAAEARQRAILERVPVSIIEEDWTVARELLRGLRAQGVTDGPAYFVAHPEFVRACLRSVRVVRRNAQAKHWEAARQQATNDASLAAVFASPQALAWFVDELSAAWAGRPIYTAQRMQRGPDGQPAVLQVTVALPDLTRADGDATALVSVTDVTDINRINAELDASLKSLARVNHELETFTYSVSHDLKAPLRGIDAYSRLLLQSHQETLSAEGRQFLTHIRSAAHQMSELIEDLLTYSRLDHARITRVPIALGPLLDGILARVQDAHPQHTLHVVQDVPEGCTVCGDIQSLTMALHNLLDNAVKFTRIGEVPRLTVRATAVGEAIEISVQDQGVGFDMKYHDRIFEIFQRLHRTEDYPGTGVGLAIVNKAMARMGGRVRAQSAPGQGATFWLHLPGGCA